MAERAFPAAPVAAYGGTRVIASPFQFSLTDDDNLQIVSANSLAGVVLAIQGRRLSAAGTIEPFSFTHVPTSNRLSRAENYKLGAGALLNLTVFVVTGAPRVGQTYVIASLIRGLSAATILLGGLLGGYVTAVQPLAYPGSPIQNSLDGLGYSLGVTGTTPAVGAEINEAVPTGAEWELVGAWFNLTSSATPAARRVLLNANIIGPRIIEALAPVDQLASTRWFYSFGQGHDALSDATSARAQSSLPVGLRMQAGASFQTLTNNLQVGDSWDTPRYLVREWLAVSS